MRGIAETCRVKVQNEFDIVTLRYTVRSMTRMLGMDLSRQAKITVAISTLARACLNDYRDVLFTVQVARQSPCSRLEVVCLAQGSAGTPTPEHVEEQLQLMQVRLLVDDVTVTEVEQGVQLLLGVELEAEVCR